MAARGEDASMVAVRDRQKLQRLGSGLRASGLDRRREAVRMDSLGMACEGSVGRGLQLGTGGQVPRWVTI